MIYRLLGGAEADIDRILSRSAAEWGISAADRYHRSMLTVFAMLAGNPDRLGASIVERVPGVRVYPLRHGRRQVDRDERVGNPRHLVVYRLATDGVVEIMGLVHDRMLLPRAARRMKRDADRMS